MDTSKRQTGVFKDVIRRTTAPTRTGSITATGKENTAIQTQTTPRGEIKCYDCRGTGHIAQNCPEKKRSNVGRPILRENKASSEAQVGMVTGHETAEKELIQDTGESEPEDDGAVYFIDTKSDISDEFKRVINI